MTDQHQPLIRLQGFSPAEASDRKIRATDESFLLPSVGDFTKDTHSVRNDTLPGINQESHLLTELVVVADLEISPQGNEIIALNPKTMCRIHYTTNRVVRQ